MKKLQFTFRKIWLQKPKDRKHARGHFAAANPRTGTILSLRTRVEIVEAHLGSFEVAVAGYLNALRDEILKMQGMEGEQTNTELSEDKVPGSDATPTATDKGKGRVGYTVVAGRGLREYILQKEGIKERDFAYERGVRRFNLKDEGIKVRDFAYAMIEIMRRMTKKNPQKESKGSPPVGPGLSGRDEWFKYLAD